MTEDPRLNTMTSVDLIAEAPELVPPLEYPVRHLTAVPEPETPTPAPVPRAEGADPDKGEGLSAEQKASLDQALKMRREGSTTDAAVAHMVENGHQPKVAALIIEQFDQTMRLMQPNPQPQLSEAQIKKLLADVNEMGARGRSVDEMVKFLTKAGVSKADALPVANRISLDVAAARAKFEASRTSARRNAMFKIAVGVVALIAGFALMGSGAESGRRSPLGVVLAGGFMIASGIKTLSDVDNMSFASRVNEVYGSGRSR